MFNTDGSGEISTITRENHMDSIRALAEKITASGKDYDFDSLFLITRDGARLAEMLIPGGSINAGAAALAELLLREVEAAQAEQPVVIDAEVVEA